MFFGSLYCLCPCNNLVSNAADMKSRQNCLMYQTVLQAARPTYLYMDVGFTCCVTDKYLFICAEPTGSVSLKIMRLKSYIFFLIY